MTEYVIELQTIHGIADSDYLDRLAELVYELPELIDPLLGLNDDGSLDVSFVVSGTDVREAALAGLDAFGMAVVEARPLRVPSEDETAHGIAAVEGFAIHKSADREKVYA